MSPVERILERLDAVSRNGNGWKARCPGHEDRAPSLSVGEGDDGRVLLRCWAGCEVGEIVAAMGLEMGDLFEQRGEGVGHPPNAPARVHTSGCTLEDYARAKQLPPDFLRSLGLSDYKDTRWSERVLRIPYRDTDGADPAVRLRISLDGPDRFLWRKGSKPFLYGLWRLEPREYVVVVEGESDAAALLAPRHPGGGPPRRWWLARGAR